MIIRINELILNFYGYIFEFINEEMFFETLLY